MMTPSADNSAISITSGLITLGCSQAVSQELQVGTQLQAGPFIIPAPLDLACQITAREARHDDVGEDQIDLMPRCAERGDQA